MANIHDAKTKIQCRFHFIGCLGKDRHNTGIHSGRYLRCALLSPNAQTQCPVYTPWCTHHPPRPRTLRNQHQRLSAPLSKTRNTNTRSNAMATGNSPPDPRTPTRRPRMLQYVRSEIAIFGQFRTHVFGQISYTLGSDLGPSPRLRTHHGSDIATDELGREVDRQSTLKVPLPCLTHIYIVTSLVLVTTHIFVRLRIGHSY